ncbi:MAG: class I SAM-dependent methyltransferase [Acidobacteriota bacterium]
MVRVRDRLKGASRRRLIGSGGPGSMDRMEWSAMGRVWAFPRRNRSARHRWEYIGRSGPDAYRMMDGSRSEAELRQRGGRMARAFAEAMGIRPSHQVLEVGCGVARIGRELAPLCGTYTGADISRSLLKRAGKRTAHLDNTGFVYLEGPGLAGLEGGRFQRLICHLVLLHLDEAEIRLLLREFRRVLSRDGIAYLDAWNLRQPQVWELFRREALDPRLRTQPHRSRFYTREALRDWLEASGLAAVWGRDDSFLLQAVAGRTDADGNEMDHLRTLLKEKGSLLRPQGRLEFGTLEPVQARRDH